MDFFWNYRLSECIEFLEARQQKIIDEQNFQMHLFGQLCSTIANFSGSKKKFKPEDFFKFHKTKKEIENKNRMNEQIANLASFVIACGGKVDL